MTPKRVLYIAYFFPPLGGAGVQRTLKFVRYLPEFGWLPTVITSSARYWMEDPSLAAEIPAGTEVVRVGGVGAPGPGTATRSRASIARARFLARWLAVPDAYLGWSMAVTWRARSILSRGRFDAIMTTSSPDSAHLAGAWIAARARLPWIADFRDPWTRRLSYRPATPLHHALHRWMERLVVRRASRVIVTSEETRADFLARIPRTSPDRIEVVMNGFDAPDFEAAERRLGGDAGPQEAAGAILHAGQLNPERPIEPYLRALSIVAARRRAAGKETPPTLFLGGHYDSDRALVSSLGLDALVRFEANRPHVESVRALLEARILLLLEQDSDRGRLILPGKVPEYLRSGRPVLAVVPDPGAAARVIRAAGAGRVASPSDVAGIVAALAALLDQTDIGVPETKDSGERILGSAAPGSPPAPRGVPAVTLKSFERRELTAKLAMILHAVSGSETPS